VRIAAVVRVTGVPESVVAAALKETWAEFNRTHREEQRTLGPEDALRLTADCLGVTVGAAQARYLEGVFAEAVLEYSPVPIEGALEAVQAAARRCPLGIVSDTGVSPGRTLRRLLARHGFTPHFSAMVFSDEVQVSKPQRLMFERAGAALGVRPCDLLHIGDLDSTDICGAKAVGARTALFAGDNTEHVADTTAEHVFHAWRDFLDLLPGLLIGED